MGFLLVFKRFFYILIATCLVILLFANLYSFSRADTTYFGFRSLIRFFDDLSGKTLYIIGLDDLPDYTTIFTNLYNSSFGLYLRFFANSQKRFLDILTVFIQTFVVPYEFISWVLCLIAKFIGDALRVIWCVGNLIAGTYNVPLT